MRARPMGLRARRGDVQGFALRFFTFYKGRAMSIHQGRRDRALRRTSCLRLGIEALEDRATPATFHVNTMLDAVAASLKTGKDAAGQVTLRSAIQAANANGKTNTIIVPQGTILLSIAGADEDASATGDLDVTRGNLTIKGAGAIHTTIDGNGLDRVLEVLGGNVNLSGVTIQGGRVTNDFGGGIDKEGGSLTLTGVTIRNNVSAGGNGSPGFGGFPGQVGDPTADGSPGGAGTIAEGGGIYNAAGTLTVTDSTISGNTARGGTGGTGGIGADRTGANGGASSAGQSATAGAGAPGVRARPDWAAASTTRRAPP